MRRTAAALRVKCRPILAWTGLIALTLITTLVMAPSAEFARALLRWTAVALLIESRPLLIVARTGLIALALIALVV